MKSSYLRNSVHGSAKSSEGSSLVTDHLSIASLYLNRYNLNVGDTLEHMEVPCPLPITSGSELVTVNAKLQEISDNVVSKDLSAKFALAVRINELIDQRGLSQMEIANIASMTQPKVSQIRCYKLHNISLERLMQALVSLGQHVEIIVRPVDDIDSASITVHAS